MVNHIEVISPLIDMKPVDEKQLQFYKDNFKKVLKNIDESFLKDKSYICGETISVADIFCACEIEQILVTGFNPLPEVPKVNAWLDKVRNELEPYYSEVHNTLEKGKLWFFFIRLFNHFLKMKSFFHN